jgi:hypothetical protein
MQLRIQLIAGDFFVVDVDGDVTDLKEAIYRERGASVASQRLIKGGRELKDDESLAASGLTPGAVVHLVIRPTFPAIATPPPPTPSPVMIVNIIPEVNKSYIDDY